MVDGHGERNLERTEGHLEGLERVRGLVQHCVKVGVEFLTFVRF